MFKTIVAVSLVCLVTGCASVAPEKRTPYTGADQVGAIDSKMLIGSWKVENINPYENEPAMDVQIAFNEDGSMTGYSKIDDGDASNPYGKMEFEMAGNWTVNGDTVSQSISKMEETSGNPIAKFGAALSLGMTKNKTTEVNLYEASANQLILVNEAEGLAQRFTRL